MDKTNMEKINHNPDILNCLANLSNDEVFTPPKVANDMLDMLPAEIWSDKTATFLDPCTKTGVFLREIVKRLMVGLEKDFPIIQDRVNHILQNQVFGMGITQLTALISRRTIYCSKKADADLSITNIFDNEQGNIIFNRIQHTWKHGKCTYCGAKQDLYDRGEDLETHAYEFLHTDKPQDLFKDAKGNAMKFDVIIGNPPYQLDDGGHGKSSKPLYHKFVQQAKKLNPRYLSMIIPARWYAGGKGLDEFRKQMLNDKSLKTIHDFPETSDCFPGLNIRGGVCYFLWDKSYSGSTCKVFNHKSDNIDSDNRPLLEDGADIFIRYNKAISILRKVKKFNENSFADRVSSRKPFGLATNYMDYTKEKNTNKDIKLFRFGVNGYVGTNDIIKNLEWVTKYKVMVPKASPGGDDYPHQVLTYPTLTKPKSCCTETYIVLGTYDNKETANNVISYTCTRFFRFLILLIKNTQDVPKRVYKFIPNQDFSKSWTDEELYKKYDITAEEQEFINTLVRPMLVQRELL